MAWDQALEDCASKNCVSCPGFFIRRRVSDAQVGLYFNLLLKSAKPCPQPMEDVPVFVENLSRLY